MTITKISLLCILIILSLSQFTMSKIKEREITIALSGCFVVIILLVRVFHITRPPVLAPQFVFNGPGTQFVFTDPAPDLYLTALVPNFYLPPLVSPEPGLAYTNLAPPPPPPPPPSQFVFIGPDLRFLLLFSDCVFTFLSIVVAVAVVILAIVVTS